MPEALIYLLAFGFAIVGGFMIVCAFTDKKKNYFVWGSCCYLVVFCLGVWAGAAVSRWSKEGYPISKSELLDLHTVKKGNAVFQYVVILEKLGNYRHERYQFICWNMTKKLGKHFPEDSKVRCDTINRDHKYYGVWMTDFAQKNQMEHRLVVVPPESLETSAE